MLLGKLDRYMPKKKNETRPPSYTIHKSKLKMDYLYVRHKTTKILEENIGSKILNTSYSNIFSDICSWARETKEKIDKWYYIKLKRFYTAKETINRMKDNPQNGRTHSQIHLIWG